MTEEKIRYLPFEILVRINREVVSLTKERHHSSEDDERSIRQLLVEVEETANDVGRSESIIQKASLLIFRIARGQYFYEGNKRTALVALQSFLAGNGFTMEIRDKDLTKIIDEVGIGHGSLSKVSQVVRRLIRIV